MSGSPSVRCFQHCDRDVNILCFRVPTMCPLCGSSTERTESRIPPYVIPSPFTDARRCPFAVVVKPTGQQFLQNGYVNGCDLHVGITTSQGEVYDYDQRGVRRGTPDWSECIAVPLVESLNRDVSANLWDDRLNKFSALTDWTPVRYEDTSHNCFDFVFDFLRSLPLNYSFGAFRSKQEFCDNIIVAHTTKASKYITLFRQIQTQGFVCQPVDR